MMRKILALLFLLSIGTHAKEFTDIEVLGTVTIETGGDMDMGGISVTDILISTDGVSSSDGVLVTAGYLAANTAGSAEALRFNAKVNEAGGITAGQVVYISGATGGFPQVSLSDNTDFSKGDTLAIANEAKADGQTIICTLSGLLENIDTSAFTEGQIMYLGTTGNMTPTHPTGTDAVQRLGHAVKINASTGSMIVDLDPLTIINNHDGTVRHQLVNQNAGTASATAYTMVNDAGHRASISLTGENFTGFVEVFGLYSEGYGDMRYHNDGNHDHVWITDTTDSHNFSGTTKMTLTAAGELQTISQLVTHTSTADNDRALRLVQDAAGFGNVEAVDIQYATGAIGLGDDDAAVVINIDRSLSTGGDIVALEVLATEGSATAIGMLTAIGIEPIHQFSGTFIDAATVLVVAVDQTAALADGGAGSISTFVNDDDTMTIGSAAKFEEVEFLMDTVASGAGIDPTFEFSTGSGTWATFNPIDGTDGMRSNGELLWLDADIPSWAVGVGTEYLIRITRTRNNLGTTPITDKVQIAAVTEYSWDENGVVSVGGVTMGGIATTDILISSDGASTSDTALVTAGYVDANASGGGKVLQVVTATAGKTSTTTQIPGDDTIPQNTEGAEFLTLAITPVSATSTLYIDFQSVVYLSLKGTTTAAIFVDSDAGAFASTYTFVDTNGTMKYVHIHSAVSSASTSTRTYKVRMGPASTGTLYNYWLVADDNGGVLDMTRITITEVEAP